MDGRTTAVEAATAMADSQFPELLAQLVAIPTESQDPARAPDLRRYLTDALGPLYAAAGFEVTVHDGPFLIARRVEDADLPTVLTYGHGDVVPGMAGRWAEGREPFALTPVGERLYGRGTADNKGQHLLNLLALQAAMKARGGRLGFNVTALIEMGEETGSLGLADFCAARRDTLAADVLIASDGPRAAPDLPTLVLGTRGVMNFALTVELRQRAHHSGNWGGIVADAGVLMAHAIAAISSPTGRIEVPEWRPAKVPQPVLDAFRDCPFDPGDAPDRPEPGWGEPGLTDWQKLGAWPSFVVRAIDLGTPAAPVNAVQPRATAYCGLRLTPDIDAAAVLPALRAHLDRHGLSSVRIVADKADPMFPATRQLPGDPWPAFVAASIARTLGRPPQVLPNAAGSLPNDVFTDLLGLPTVWIPHSYTACGQHAPDEHLLLPVVREGLALMAGLWWDLGGSGLPDRAAKAVA